MHPADALERLRANRNKPDSDCTLAGLLGSEKRKLRNTVRAVGGIDDAWRRVAPAEVVDKARVVKCRRGVLTVRVRDASAMFRINQWLATGGMDELRQAAGRGITRVAFMHG